jgi:FKBP-type peptidyl-prolyl cis-trans isomerase 2
MPKKSSSKGSAKKPAKSAKPKKTATPIKAGYFVKVEYTGTLEDGSLFDSTEKQGCPLEFQIGAQQVIDGFEKAIVAMELNEEKEITLRPEEAYGEYQKDMSRDIPRNRLPAEGLDVGMTLMATLPQGIQVPVTITAMNKETVTLDMNHPLAGKVLNFKLKLVEIREGELHECTGTCGGGCSCQ